LGADNRIRITVETERILIISGQAASRQWCKECDREVAFLSQNQAGFVLMEPAPDKPGRWQRSKVLIQYAKEGLIVCAKSLLNYLQATAGGSKSHKSE